jgi:hypothetical protein
VAITINRKLNLVLPIDLDEHRKIYFHSMPISVEVFDANFWLLTQTLANLYAHGIGPSMSPRIALRALRDTAKQFDDTQDVSLDLINEIYRLTNVVMPGTNGGGWVNIPYYEVKSKKLVDEQVLVEVENAIVYFIVASALHLRNELEMAYQGLITIWKAETTLLGATDYMRSLPILTQTANTGEKPRTPHTTVITAPQKTSEPASSIPS